MHDSSRLRTNRNGIIVNLQLLRELRKVSSNSGVINVIIRGAPITEPLSFILLLKRTFMAITWKMKFLLELLHINWIAKIVLSLLTPVNSNLRVTD